MLVANHKELNHFLRDGNEIRCQQMATIAILYGWSDIFADSSVIATITVMETGFRPELAHMWPVSPGC
uniref:Uncharacterized protein n=1 Tax=Strigamia maritima TaxID=126957 RepID=T1IRJ4_STRMM